MSPTKPYACFIWGRRLALFCGSLLAAANPQADVSKEYQIKAAFLYNFTKFVEWPANRFASPDAPIVIGVLGNDPFGDELEKSVRDRKVNGRPLSIVVIHSMNEVAAVHVLFVCAGGEKRFGAAPVGSYAGVLTVGESDLFAATSGMVNFSMLADKVRFEINVDAAMDAGLRISAQLLKLAITVRKSK